LLRNSRSQMYRFNTEGVKKTKLRGARFRSWKGGPLRGFFFRTTTPFAPLLPLLVRGGEPWTRKARAFFQNQPPGSLRSQPSLAKEASFPSTASPFSFTRTCLFPVSHSELIAWC
jgi:hypothetical protein